MYHHPVLNIFCFPWFPVNPLISFLTCVLIRNVLLNFLIFGGFYIHLLATEFCFNTPVVKDDTLYGFGPFKFIEMYFMV